MTDRRADAAHPLRVGDLSLPTNVEAALSTAAPPSEGALFLARWGDVSRFVLLIRAVAEAWLVAPVTLEPELATEEAYVLGEEVTDFEVPLAVWLDLAVEVRPAVLEQRVGRLRVSMSDVRHAPTGRRLRTLLDERAMERATLQDDMAELAAVVVPQEQSLAQLLGGLDLAALEQAGITTVQGFALLRGERPVTGEEAELLAPLAGVSAEKLVAAGPRVSEEEVRWVLRDAEVARLVARLAERGGQTETEVAAPAVHRAHALAARETGSGEVDLVARLVQYLKAALGDE